MFKVGMIGVGSIADVYLLNSRQMSNYRVVAVASRDEAEAGRRAAGWGVEGLSVDALLRRSDIEAVLNLTPPAAHHAVTRAALEAGKHVFTEKPLAADLEEALDLADLAAQRGLRLAVAPDSVLGAGVQRARAMIDSGAIGRPLMANAAILYHGADGWHPNPSFFYRRGGGPVHDVGPYFLAVMMNLFGPLADVRATGFKGFETRTVTAPGREKGNTVPVEVLTSVLALLNFRSGVQASLSASWDVWRTSLPHIEIHGTEGSLSLPHPNFHGGPLRYARPGGDWEDVSLDDAPLARPNWPVGQPQHANYRGIGLAETIDAIDAHRPHRLSAEFGAHVVEAADAIILSATSGKSVDLVIQPERPEPLGTSETAALMRPSPKDTACP
ncbi:Gfo/Idh/MocA family oxidoreductase [Mesorhizobium sp. BR1-1-16]|uniref:Gfo/Idh/MocA family protein n=1 Tax=Mesorhizobium sp. BR1-1-16 TaxID=2876653 RepID=UPI001CCDE429|nr:Gfo/Idh/MocA family oxidoreductase [Mesorhizobium sp. BR1-1-16]MBZ9938559.1 Gfo/Idh/MocA family oxidoreductase [Mesorhizobium sp. BR1-1-16]